jgi:hypothetical protein
MLVNVVLGTSAIFKRKSTDEELIIDTNNPDKDIYRLELGKELATLKHKKSITLKIVLRVISQ